MSTGIEKIKNKNKRKQEANFVNWNNMRSFEDRKSEERQPCRFLLFSSKRVTNEGRCPIIRQGDAGPLFNLPAASLILILQGAETIVD